MKKIITVVKKVNTLKDIEVEFPVYAHFSDSEAHYTVDVYTRVTSDMQAVEITKMRYRAGGDETTVKMEQCSKERLGNLVDTDCAYYEPITAMQFHEVWSSVIHGFVSQLEVEKE